ncbi:MAG: DNA cytosine methyltransferase [Candidatus Gastranaerophilales bacterium]|nr:DNA cytosine methyltransferase [Candidatus Gastranaerophilales bacterium]
MIELDEKEKKSLSKYTFIDLFAGIGGFRYALESFGANCVFSSEWNKSAQDIYQENFNDRPDGDITEIDEKRIPPHDILCGGFPCQSFSISGKRLGFQDTRGTLFFDIARIAKYHQPKILFLENVKNFAKHNNGKTLNIIVSTLESIGYNVFYKVLNSGYFGVPQTRERIYIIAINSKLGINSFKFPTGSMTPIALKDILLSFDETEKYIINRKDIKITEDLIINKNILNSYPLKPIRVGYVNKGGQGERIYHEKGHAITLSAYGGGIGAKTGLYLTKNTVRKLAPKECARAMGFPDDFIHHSSDAQAYKQFGNSVVVNVLQEITKEFANIVS